MQQDAEIKHCVAWTKPNILEEHITTIFRVEDQAKQETQSSRSKAEMSGFH
jgi:hypothetical protein